jgi:hypothetical protein
MRMHLGGVGWPAAPGDVAPPPPPLPAPALSNSLLCAPWPSFHPLGVGGVEVRAAARGPPVVLARVPPCLDLVLSTRAARGGGGWPGKRGTCPGDVPGFCGEGPSGRLHFVFLTLCVGRTGLAFTDASREALGISGLLPYAVNTSVRAVVPGGQAVPLSCPVAVSPPRIQVAVVPLFRAPPSRPPSLSPRC